MYTVNKYRKTLLTTVYIHYKAIFNSDFLNFENEIGIRKYDTYSGKVLEWKSNVKYFVGVNPSYAIILI